MRKVVFDFYKVIYDPKREKVDTQVLEIIQSLYRENIPLYIFTNSSFKALKRRDEQEQFLKYFKNIICNKKYPKPHPNSFEKLLTILDCSPDEIVLIDDSEHILKRAQEYDILTLRYTNDHSLKIALKKLLNIEI